MRKMMTAATAAYVLISGAALAQQVGGPSDKTMEKMREVMANQAFSASVVMTMTGSKRSSKVTSMEFRMAMSKGRTRTEMDMAKMAGASGANAGAMPPGMSKMVNIVLPEKKISYQVMPDINAYCEIPIRAEVAAKADSKVERKTEGAEKVEKYNCDKVRNIVTAKDGKRSEFITWEAKELKGFPVKVETTTDEGKMTMLFTDIDTKQPAEALFAPPEGATKYSSMAAMMMASFKQMMQQRE